MILFKSFEASSIPIPIFIGTIGTHPQIIPAVTLYTLDGLPVNSTLINNANKPMIMVFFKSYDKKCRENLIELREAHEEVLAEKGVKMVAICIDCTGSIEHIKPFVYGNGLNIDRYNI